MPPPAANLPRPLLRSRRLRALAALVLLVLAVRLFWGWWVGRQLQAQLDQIRRRGEPTTAAEVAYASVSDENNAWLLQMAAAKALVKGVDSPRESNLDYPQYLPYPPEWTKLAKASEEANGQAFALARQARARLGAQIRQRLTLPVKLENLSYVYTVRRLANTVTDGAVYAHLSGDDAEAIERLLDGFHISRSFRHDDFAVPQLVGIGVDNLVCDTTRLIAPGLRLNSNLDPTLRDRTRRLIQLLLDEDLPAQGLRRSIMVERLSWINWTQDRSTGTWFIRPLAMRDVARTQNNFALMAKATTCKNYPEARSFLNGCAWEQLIGSDPSVLLLQSMFGTVTQERVVPRYSRWFYDQAADLSPYIERHFRNLAERRLTAVSLACHLYRYDRGYWPDKLDQLVPDYLPALPPDPFRADGQPLGYVVLQGKLPGGGNRPLLYFEAGPDGPVPQEPTYSWHFDPRPGDRRDPIRQYRDLTRFVPPKSQEAVDHDPEEAHNPWQQPQYYRADQQPQPQQAGH